MSAYAFSFPKLAQAGEIKLADFAGKAVLVVNVASACGLTPQYTALEALYQAKAGQGLVVLGAPCNDFGAQESASEADIRRFCDAKYNVTFPLTGKVEIVAPERRHPFYAWVAGQIGEEAMPRWNFHKFLIGKDGALAGAFGSRTEPGAPELAAAIDQALEA